MAVSEEAFLDSLDHLQGKVAVVTGGAGTIGYQSALYLAAKGCKVYIADTAPRLASIAKSPDSSPASFIAGSGQRVRASGVEAIGSHVLDLASVKTASESAQKFLELEDRLDIVLAAAGVMQLSQSELSPDGWERTWAITHLGHFVFLNTLLPLLKRSAIQTSPSRISFVISDSYETSTVPDWEQLRTTVPDDFSTRGFLQRGYYRYRVAKLCNVYYVQDIASRLAVEAGPGKQAAVLINCCNPGVNGRTHLGNSVFSPLVESLIKGFVALISHTPRDCAKTGVYLAASSEIRTGHATGQYWKPQWSWFGYWTGCKSYAYTTLGLDEAQRQECWHRTEAAVIEAQSR